jgi:hypothetical protein
MPTGPQTSGKAIAALVCTIAAFPFWCFVGIPAIVGLFLASSAKKEIRASGGRLTGEGMVTAAQILGWIAVGLTIVGIGLIILGAVTSSNSSTAVVLAPA